MQRCVSHIVGRPSLTIPDIGGKPTPRDSQLFTIVGTIQSLCGLGERCLLVETERSFTTSSYIGYVTYVQSIFKSNERT